MQASGKAITRLGIIRSRVRRVVGHVVGIITAFGHFSLICAQSYGFESRDGPTYTSFVATKSASDLYCGKV